MTKVEFKMSMNDFNDLLPAGWKHVQYANDGGSLATKWSLFTSILLITRFILLIDVLGSALTAWFITT